VRHPCAETTADSEDLYPTSGGSQPPVSFPDIGDGLTDPNLTADLDAYDCNELLWLLDEIADAIDAEAQVRFIGAVREILEYRQKDLLMGIAR
jgi:hypothetical protein